MGLKRSIKGWIVGILYGCAAFCGGYLLTFLLASGRVEEFLSSAGRSQTSFSEVIGQVGESAGPGTARVVSWFHLGAHRVAFEMKANALFGGSGTVSVSVSDSPAWMDVLWIVPPAVLVGVGYLYVRKRTAERSRSILGGAVALTIGYAVIGVAALVLSTWQLNVGVAVVSFVPNGADAVMLLVYPAIFGTVGCVLGDSADSSRAEQGRAEGSRDAMSDRERSPQQSAERRGDDDSDG